jgi:hypothetical protein
MLVRAVELRPAITEWTSKQYSNGLHAHHHLSETEWMHVRYLIAILYPYCLWTESLSATSDVTIHKALSVHTGLFKHLEDLSQLLLGKKQMWKVKLADSVLAAHQKLASYYRNTDGPRGQIYNWATVLDPAQRLETYKTSNFDNKLLRAYESDFWRQYK